MAATAGRAGAVPVFARKYQTSCQTCHVAFPKLTPFGEAFRRNGYRFPVADEEEENTKQPPVKLGQEAHKKVFPRAVWPGELPGDSPFAATIASSVVFQPSSPRASFAGVGATIGLNAAATLGDVFSAWAGISVMAMPKPSGGETVMLGIERAFVSAKPFEQPWLLLRTGRIEPAVLGSTMHRTLGLPPKFASTPTGDDGFALEPTQLGLEASGVVGRGRVAYSLGLVEGANSIVNTPKDVYGRVAWKLGGLRLDGQGAIAESEPWREKSLTLGVFGYRGEAQIGDPELAVQTDRFWFAGADANILYGDANLALACLLGRNARPTLATPNAGISGWQASAQLDYVVFPWLVPTLRVERVASGHDSQSRISGGFYALLRAQVRTQVLASVEGPDSHLEFGQVTAGLNVAF